MPCEPRRRRFAVAGALTLVAAFVAAPAVARPLTFAETLAVAESRSPAALAKELERQALLEEAAAARTRPDPILSIGVVNLPVTSGDRFRFDRDDMTMKSVGIAQEFTRRSKRNARAAAIAARASVSAAEQALVLTQVRSEAAQSWFDLFFAQATRAELERLRKEAELDLAAARAAYAGGNAGQADVIAAQAQIVAIDDRRSLSVRDIEVARAQLARWTGTDVDAAAGEPPRLETPPIDAAHLDHVVEAHPGVAVFSARAAQAQAEIAEARADRRADWTVEAMYGQRDQNLSDMASVTLRIPLQFNRKNRQDRVVGARLAQAQAAAAEREEAERLHRAELSAVLAAWRNGRERIARYRESLTPLAQARAEAALAAYRGGAGSLRDLVAARRARFDVALETLALEAETAKAWTELRAVAGTLDPQEAGAAGVAK